MATMIYPTVPVAQPAAEPRPLDDDPIGIQADEMFARQLDTGFAGEVRTLLFHPDTGLAARSAEDALAGVAETLPRLGELKERTLAQAIGPRQRVLLEPLIDARLDRATADLGRIARQATSDLDDRTVAERIADLEQDAALAWHDPAHLRVLGRAAVNELRYQGERKGRDAAETDTIVRRGLSDLYAGAVEAAVAKDPDAAAKLYEHARDVIRPERQAAVERRIDRARGERRVIDVMRGLAGTPDDPTRRPDLADFQARAAELTPPDASPEMRGQVNRMAAIGHAQADRAWQVARGRAAMAALDWLGRNPAAPLLAMPPALRDGLSPQQTERLDAAAINGGRIRTVAGLYDNLVLQTILDPEGLVSTPLDQHRLSLGDTDYKRLVGWQDSIKSGRDDATLVRLGLAFDAAGTDLKRLGYDLADSEAKDVRAKIYRDVLTFDELEGRPANRIDIAGIVFQAIAPLSLSPAAKAANSGTVPSIVPVADEDAPLDIDWMKPLDDQGDGADIAGTGVEGDIQVANAQDRATVKSDVTPNDMTDEQQVAQAPSPKPGTPGIPTGKPPAQDAKAAAAAKRREEGQRAWDKAIRAPYVEPVDPRTRQALLPDNWEESLNAIGSRYADMTKEAAIKRGVPPELLARLFYKESRYIASEVSRTGAKGIAQLTPGALRAVGIDPKTFRYEDPQASIEAGAAYLALMFREFKNWPKAVAAYNMGPTRLYQVLRGDAALKPETQAELTHVFRGKPEAFDHPNPVGPNQRQ